jgi:glycosyltransferase involved in cell wall biosynthesis
VKVSVIVPTFNRSAFVKEAVASVLAQNGVAMEVIVVDDGSTDGTSDVLESYGAAIRCLKRSHGGVSAARNTGILAAGGEWLAFLDSDDLWRPGKLAAQFDYFSRNPEMKICQTDEIWIRNGLRLNPKLYHQKPQGHCFPLLLERCLVSPSAVIIHRDLFDEVGLFDESLPACEDYDLWLRIGCRRPIGLVPKPLIVKRGGHADQLTATVPALDLYRIQSLAKLLRTAPLDPVQQRLAMQILERKCLIYGEGCRKRGKAEEAASICALPRLLAAELGIIS